MFSNEVQNCLVIWGVPSSDHVMLAAAMYYVEGGGGSPSKLSGHYQSQLPMSRMNRLPPSSQHKLEATGSSESWLSGCHITEDSSPCEHKMLDAAC